MSLASDILTGRAIGPKPASSSRCRLRGQPSNTVVGDGANFARVINISMECPAVGLLLLTTDNLTGIGVTARIRTTGAGLTGPSWTLAMTVGEMSMLIGGDSVDVEMRGPVGARMSALFAPVVP